MDALVERGVGALQRVHGERAEHVGGVGQDVCLQSGQQSNRQHALGAIDQRDRLFGLQHQRLDASLLQRLRGGHALAAEPGFALGDQHQRQMRQRSQIAAGAHAALRRNDRMHAAVQHLAKRVDDRRTHAGEALGERVGAQQHHGAGNVFGQRFAHAGRVRAQQVDLQLADIVWRDAQIGKFADAGVHRIGDAIVLQQVFDHGARTLHRDARLGLQQDRAPLVDHLANIVQASDCCR